MADKIEQLDFKVRVTAETAAEVEELQKKISDLEDRAKAVEVQDVSVMSPKWNEDDMNHITDYVSMRAKDGTEEEILTELKEHFATHGKKKIPPLELLRAKLEYAYQKTDSDSEEVTRKSDEYLAALYGEKLATPDPSDRSNLINNAQGIAGKLPGIAANPLGAGVGLGQDLLGNVLSGTKFLPVIGLITTALSSPQILRSIISVMEQPGGPLDPRFVRSVITEQQVGISREQQKLTDEGKTLVIFSQTTGYLPNNEGWAYSNQFQITEGRIARVSQDERARGNRV